jgi:hypothetical protein
VADAIGPFVLCMTGFTQVVNQDLNIANRQTQATLFSIPRGRGGCLRLPVSSGFMFEFILTELP